MGLESSAVEVTRLGPYEIVRKLARGGMAELFLARTRGPEGFERLVVLKKILPAYADSPKFVRLFLDEAKLVSTLDHPHIARVYDTGQVDGQYFIAMEYIHGEDVRATLRRTSRLDRKVPVAHAIEVARHVAAALHYAHGLDVIHRDVSPSNIVISYDGAVKLVDFGVAKATTSSVQTRTGALKGKIAYMSPEQAKGTPIDRRSDIFSLGIVLWELATTTRLFRADNDLATLQLIINSKAQPPSQLNPEVSPELDRIITRALATEVEARYQTAEEMQRDLDAIADPRGSLRGYMHDVFEPELSAWHHAQASGQTLTQHVVINLPTEMTRPVSEGELDFISEDEEFVDDDGDSEQATALHVPLDPRLIEEPPAAPFPVAPAEWRPEQPIDHTRRTKQFLIAGSIVFAVIVLIAAIFGSPPSADSPHVIHMTPIRP